MGAKVNLNCCACETGDSNNDLNIPSLNNKKIDKRSEMHDDSSNQI